MNKMKIFFKVLSLAISITFITGLLKPITSNAEVNNYLKVHEKIQNQYSEGVPAEDILMNLDDEEKAVFLDYYVGTVNTGLSSSNIQTALTEDFSNIEEIMVVDSFAAEIYKFYEEYGYFPTGVIRNSSLRGLTHVFYMQ